MTTESLQAQLADLQWQADSLECQALMYRHRGDYRRALEIQAQWHAVVAKRAWLTPAGRAGAVCTTHIAAQ